MPGYQPRSPLASDALAESVREAQALAREGDRLTAVHLLEEAMAASLLVRSEMPGWLCGRLAALYRTIGRYDDEVRLLERYRDSQSADDARSRFDARLSKARTIAERKRRTENGALTSVTRVLGARRRRRSAAAPPAQEDGPAPALSLALLTRLTAALHVSSAAPDGDETLATTLGEIASTARAGGVPVDQLVAALRVALQPARREDDGADPRYSAALLRILAAYFDEGER